ncbi:MAG TPA: tetratricopeptide repeat protein [Crocinitomix sp.]|nr:tetratricopeptide repeat protein [Crocinitomix sp.]
MSINVYLNKALDKVNQNDFETSIELFTKVLKLDPSHKDAYYHRGVSYLNLEKIDLAIFDFNKLIELDPNYAFYYSCRGFAKSRLGDKKGAIEDYFKSLELEPDNEITLNNLGLVQEELGYMEQAKKSFEKSDAIRKNENYQPETFGEPSQHPKKLKIDEKQNTQSKSQLAKEIFTKKSTFKEFLSFIKNGFKLKDH